MIKMNDVINEKFKKISPPKYAQTLKIEYRNNPAKWHESIKTEKFKPMPNKIFNDGMPDGFWVEKLKLNKLYGVIL